mmetsp:Transcript_25611/g.73938  ORF Transcript_25611/g.73938 Transcript_25611/m.73938 type:complete len:205 (+) Transcript_25611:981-1595(+)
MAALRAGSGDCPARRGEGAGAKPTEAAGAAGAAREAGGGGGARAGAAGRTSRGSSSRKGSSRGRSSSRGRGRGSSSGGAREGGGRSDRAGRDRGQGRGFSRTPCGRASVRGELRHRAARVDPRRRVHLYHMLCPAEVARSGPLRALVRLRRLRRQDHGARPAVPVLSRSGDYVDDTTRCLSSDGRYLTCTQTRGSWRGHGKRPS